MSRILAWVDGANSAVTPLLLDEARVGKLASACDLIDDEQPRRPDWKQRQAEAYAALARACNTAASNAHAALQNGGGQ